MDEKTAAPPGIPHHQTTRRNGRRHLLAALTGIAAFTPAMAQGPQSHRTVEPAQYRTTGARHLYNAYKTRIFKGKLPPLLYAITITETEIDENGKVIGATIVREPAAAKEVGPWVLSLIRSASPFPRPGRPGRTVYRDIWLVDKSYRFQLDTLTEGQL